MTMSEQRQDETLAAIIWLFETKPTLETALQHPLVKDSPVARIMVDADISYQERLLCACGQFTKKLAIIDDLLALSFVYFVESGFKMEPFRNIFMAQVSSTYIAQVFSEIENTLYEPHRTHLRNLDSELYRFLFNIYRYNSGSNYSSCFWTLARYSPRALSLMDLDSLWRDNRDNLQTALHRGRDLGFISNGLEYFANASEEDAKEIAALIPLEVNKKACELSPDWKIAIEKFMNNSKTVKTLI